MSASRGVLFVLAGMAGAVASCSLFVTFNDSLIPADDTGVLAEAGGDSPAIDSTPIDGGDSTIADGTDGATDTSGSDTSVTDTTGSDTAATDTATADTTASDTTTVDTTPADLGADVPDDLGADTAVDDAPDAPDAE